MTRDDWLWYWSIAGVFVLGIALAVLGGLLVFRS